MPVILGAGPVGRCLTGCLIWLERARMFVVEGGYTLSAPRGFDVSAVLDDRVRRLQRDLEAADEAVGAVPEALRARLAGGLRNEIARKSDAINMDLRQPLQ